MKIVVVGAHGRMGRALIESVVATPDASLHAALGRADSPLIGQPVSVLGINSTVTIGSNIMPALQNADVLIDFTRPEGTLTYLAACLKQGVKMVIGTTGFDEAGKAAIYQASEQIGIVFSSNFSVGVNLIFKLLALAARTLDDQYDVEIIETHHRHKVDAPSGTALSMGEAIAKAKGRLLQDVAVYARGGVISERMPGSIGFATVRGGDVVGEHTALFATVGERIEMTHKASSRTTFASGAVRAALWLAEHPQGLFDMQDVLAW